MRSRFALATALLVPSFLNAQTPPPPQTARQALIEMFFGQAPNHLEKHLPDVTRRTFQKLGTANGQNALAEFSMLASQAKAGGGRFETFDTGPSLLVAEQPQTGSDKVEITVERDDLIGDEDQIEVALHMTSGGKEQTLPFIPRFTFSMKMESDVWRLNEVSVTVRLPLADPDFLKSVEDRQRNQNERMVTGAVRMVVTAESSYQSLHGSFVCGLSALRSGKQADGNWIYFDPDVASGKKYGYVFAITACDAAHYKIVAEPAVPDSGQRAFCSDESGTVRASSNGKATTCLSSGEVVGDKIGGNVATGVLVANQSTESSAKAQPAQSVERVPAQRIRVSQGVSQGLILSTVQPVYPEEALIGRIQGSVVLKALIARTGDVLTVELVSGHPLLAPAAMDAVRQWKYRPYLLNGSPVEVDTQVTVNFTLSGH